MALIRSIRGILACGTGDWNDVGLVAVPASWALYACGGSKASVVASVALLGLGNDIGLRGTLVSCTFN